VARLKALLQTKCYDKQMPGRGVRRLLYQPLPGFFMFVPTLRQDAGQAL